MKFATAAFLFSFSLLVPPLVSVLYGFCTSMHEHFLLCHITLLLLCALLFNRADILFNSLIVQVPWNDKSTLTADTWQRFELMTTASALSFRGISAVRGMSCRP